MIFVCWELELSFCDSSKAVLQTVYSYCMWETKLSLHLSLITAWPNQRIPQKSDSQEQGKGEFCLLNPPISGKQLQPTVGWNNGWPLCHAHSNQKQQPSIKTHNPHCWRTKSSLPTMAPASCMRNALAPDSFLPQGWRWPVAATAAWTLNSTKIYWNLPLSSSSSPQTL